jgi:hypothetical protein
MATTTPNFGWSVPTSSDLVKNGATAIETLGDSIDASLVDLKGGTTGQVLAKATNTDMDFTWTTASSGSSNVAGKNGVLNSNFSIWQRGTTFTDPTSAYYTADRWQTVRYGAVAGSTYSRQATGDTTNLPFIQYCMRLARTSGNTSTAELQLSQSFETVNSIQYAGKTVSLSFYARKGANYSATSDALTVNLASGTGTDQNLLTVGLTGQTNVINSTATLTTTWQRFTFSGTVSASATQVALYFKYTPTGTAGANDYFEMTGVQVEIAASASAYSPATSTQALELAACQRYYSRVNGTTVGGATWINGHITGSSPSYAIACYQYPVEMRVAPTITQSGSVRVSSASTLNDFSAFAGGAAVKSLRTLYTPTSVTNGYACHIDFLSTAFIEMSAEL